MMNAHVLRLMILAVLGSSFLFGCGAYVDISDENAGRTGHDPNTQPVRDVMIEAIKATVKAWNYTESYAFVLPPNTDYPSYQDVYIKLGSGPTLESDTGLPVIKIEEIRARGYKAEVDVSRPAEALYPDGERQLITVHMKNDPMSGWRTSYVKTWRVGVGDLPQNVIAIDIEALRAATVPPVKQEMEEETQPADDQAAPVEMEMQPEPVTEPQAEPAVETAAPTEAEAESPAAESVAPVE